MQPQLTQKCIILISRNESPHFKIQNRILNPSPSDVIIKTVCFSVDPVMKFSMAGARTYFRKVEIGDIFNCFGLARIVRGNQDWQTGAYIFGNIGTCDCNILDQQRQNQCFIVPTQLVQKYGHNAFIYLINNGLAAYAGFQILSPQPNDTVVVSTASGATGLLLCQLLHKKGIKVIGLTSAHKFKILQPYTYLTADYKDVAKLQQILKDNPFSMYFDNVGQHLLDIILDQIKINGRIALCGAIANYSNYNNRGITNTFKIISKRLTLTGLTFMGMMGKIDHIFKQYEGVQLKIIPISMDQFEECFMGVLSSGNSVVGKIVVQT